MFDGTIDDTIETLPPGEEFCVNGGQCVVVRPFSDDQEFFCDCGINELTGERYTGAHCEKIAEAEWAPSVSPRSTASANPTTSLLPSQPPPPPPGRVCNPLAPVEEQKYCKYVDHANHLSHY